MMNMAWLVLLTATIIVMDKETKKQEQEDQK